MNRAITLTDHQEAAIRTEVERFIAYAPFWFQRHFAAAQVPHIQRVGICGPTLMVFGGKKMPIGAKTYNPGGVLLRSSQEDQFMVVSDAAYADISQVVAVGIAF